MLTLRSSLVAMTRAAAHLGRTLVVLALVGTSACGKEALAPRDKPVCLVLSVGAERGIAHIGVVRALQEAGIQPSCVFGNSMGALVGALHAAAPERDTAQSYGLFMHLYEERAAEEMRSRAVMLGLLALGATLASGGAAAPAIAAGAAGAAVGAGSVDAADKDRLVEVLDEVVGHRNIEQLPLQYATWYQRVTNSGVERAAALSGNLAHAVGDSVANPMIFPNLRLDEGQHIDPGADRIAAIPLEDACKLRPDAHFIVSNASGGRLFFSTEMRCSYELVEIATPEVDRQKVLLAESPDFDQMVAAGYRAATSVLRSRSGAP